MSRNKKIYKPKSFESTGASDDTSANIYMSMLLSPKWQELTKRQQILYVYCKAQYYAEKKKPKPMIANIQEDEIRQLFTMNKSKWCKLYKIYCEGGQGNFAKDMRVLQEKGFIEVIENGKTSRTKNIYKLSNKWRE